MNQTHMKWCPVWKGTWNIWESAREKGKWKVGVTGRNQRQDFTHQPALCQALCWVLGIQTWVNRIPVTLCQFGRYNKLPRTGWLKQCILISHSAGGWKFEISVPGGLGAGEGLPPNLQMAMVLPMLTWWKESWSLSLLTRTLISSGGGGFYPRDLI